MFDTNTLQALYRYSVSVCNDQNLAYDILQTAIEKCIARGARVGKDVQLSYVKAVIRNAYIDQYRRQARFPEALFEEDVVVPMDANSLEDMVIAESELEGIWQNLSDAERELLYLWAVEEYTVQEMAELLNTPKGTLLSRLHRLKKRIGGLQTKPGEVKTL